ncbi:hypothetical protein ES703_93039 [subsurface metagenome]
MTNKKIKRTKKKSIQKKEIGEGFFTILFFLITIYIAILGGIYSAVSTLNKGAKSISQEGFFISIPGIILIALGVLVFFYLLFILFVGLIELGSYYNKLSPKSEKIRKVLRKSVLYSPFAIILNTFLISYFSILLLFVYFKPISAIILTLLLVFMIALTSILLTRKNTQFLKNILSFHTIKKPKLNFWGWAYTILSIITILSLMLILFSVSLFHSTYFDVQLNKEIYFMGEDVYITIYPKGIVKPVPLNITYSNKKIPLEYIKHSQFGLSPIYLKIPSEILVSQPYNSYLQIKYEISQFKWLYSEKLSHDIFIPVFNESNNSSYGDKPIIK